MVETSKKKDYFKISEGSGKYQVQQMVNSSLIGDTYKTAGSA
jgi:hypothetical protein